MPDAQTACSGCQAVPDQMPITSLHSPAAPAILRFEGAPGARPCRPIPSRSADPTRGAVQSGSSSSGRRAQPCPDHLAADHLQKLPYLPSCVHGSSGVASASHAPRRQRNCTYVAGITLAHTTARTPMWLVCDRRIWVMAELALWPACAFESSQDWVREQASWTYVMLHWLPSYFWFGAAQAIAGVAWSNASLPVPAAPRFPFLV